MYGTYFFLNIFGHILWIYNFDFIFEEELNIFEINTIGDDFRLF